MGESKVFGQVGQLEVDVNSLKPIMKINPSKIKNLEKGFDLDAICSEYNGVLSNSIRVAKIR